MELTFTKQGNLYESIFEATGDFNLHLELDKIGYIGVYQRGTSEGLFSLSHECKFNDARDVYDIDFGALVYPKWIKVTSSSNVVKGEVTFG